MHLGSDPQLPALGRLVEEASPVATQPQSVPYFPLPDQEQAIALQIVSDYLSQAGTQAATFLLGCPRISTDTTSLADLCNRMLSGAALCAGLVAISADAES